MTASGSGLDPQISVDAATLQVNRIVLARKAEGGKAALITPEQVQTLVTQNTDGRSLGILGEPGVNVPILNLALANLFGAPPAPAR